MTQHPDPKFFAPEHHRLQLTKTNAREMVAQLKARGFSAKVASLKRVEVYRQDFPSRWNWVGSFYWDTDRRSWMLYTVKPFVHTRHDFELAMDEMAGELERVIEVEHMWDEFKASRSAKPWKRYVGAVVSFYERLFAR